MCVCGVCVCVCVCVSVCVRGKWELAVSPGSAGNCLYMAGVVEGKPYQHDMCVAVVWTAMGRHPQGHEGHGQWHVMQRPLTHSILAAFVGQQGCHQRRYTTWKGKRAYGDAASAVRRRSRLVGPTWHTDTAPRMRMAKHGEWQRVPHEPAKMVVSSHAGAVVGEFLGIAVNPSLAGGARRGAQLARQWVQLQGAGGCDA